MSRSRKQVKDKIKFTTEGDQRADELAPWVLERMEQNGWRANFKWSVDKCKQKEA